VIADGGDEYLRLVLQAMNALQWIMRSRFAGIPSDGRRSFGPLSRATGKRGAHGESARSIPQSGLAAASWVVTKTYSHNGGEATDGSG
jgi:hypothetical protein